MDRLKQQINACNTSLGNGPQIYLTDPTKLFVNIFTQTKYNKNKKKPNEGNNVIKNTVNSVKDSRQIRTTHSQYIQHRHIHYEHQVHLQLPSKYECILD